MIIGKIIEVRGVKVIAQFFEKLPPHLINNGDIFPAPQINSYVKTNVGLDTIICQIIGEYLKTDENGKETDYNVELEVRGRVSNGKFLGGLRLLPFVDAKVETLSEIEFKSIFANKDYSICIGENLYDSSNKIFLEINKLIPSHIGIFGNTGSGKSNTLARIIKEYLNCTENKPNKNNAKLIIIDLNNEYGNNAICKKSKKKIYKLSTRKHIENINDNEKIPLNFSKLKVEDYAIILNAREKTQVPIIKKAYKEVNKYDSSIPHRGEGIIKSLLINKKTNLFFIIRHYLGNMISGIDNINYNYNSGVQTFYYNDDTNISTKYIDDRSKIKKITINYPENWLDRFELELILEVALQSESGVNFEYTSPLLSRMQSKKSDILKVFKDTNDENHYQQWFKDTNLMVLQLGDVNIDMRETISSLISELVFDIKSEERDNDKVKSIINIVIDEAHNLLSYDDEITELHNNTLRVFEKIIKEGRKYGVFLFLASQRPSDISNTITSQLHNYFIHKLVNPNDIEKIRKTVAYMGESSLNMITVLGAGECIISGNALSMPQYVYVNELDKDYKPNSADIILFGENGILEENDG